MWGIRFASPAHGFVFGGALWETTDGGATWARDATPGGAILSLATIDGQVLALTARCSRGGGCARRAALLRRPLQGGSWTLVAQVHVADWLSPTDLIGTQAKVAAVLDGTSVLVSRDGGKTLTKHAGPCITPPFPYPVSVAVTSPHGLAVLCTGQGYTGHTGKQAYLSGDDGSHWVSAGKPSSLGDGGTIAAASQAHLVIATMSAASWLYYSPGHGARWRTVVFKGDGGLGWADLGFTTATHGVVVYAPARADGNPGPRQGRLLLTSDAGATWHRVRY